MSPLAPAAAPRNKRWSHTPEFHTASACEGLQACLQHEMEKIQPSFVRDMQRGAPGFQFRFVSGILVNLARRYIERIALPQRQTPSPKRRPSKDRRSGRLGLIKMAELL